MEIETCRTIENVELWQWFREGTLVRHLTTTNNLHHQSLINGLKLSTHYDLIVVALLYNELQTIFLTQNHRTHIEGVPEKTAQSFTSHLLPPQSPTSQIYDLHPHGHTHSLPSVKATNLIKFSIIKSLFSYRYKQFNSFSHQVAFLYSYLALSCVRGCKWTLSVR